MLVITVTAVALLMTSVCASAQWAHQEKKGGIGVSYAYSGDDNGFRLELAREKFTIDGGWFQSDDGDEGDVYCLELGMNPTGQIQGYGGIPFMIGAGAYQFNAEDANVDDTTDFNIWAGAGDFDHSSKGLFYQYRYIFGGPLSGSQGILGWAF
jgi:hypothetical protein